MAAFASTKELRKMTAADLRKEIADKRADVAKLSIGVQMRSEKDTAKFTREKKNLARLLTVLREKEMTEALKDDAKTTTVPTSASAGKSSSRKKKAS